MRHLDHGFVFIERFLQICPERICVFNVLADLVRHGNIDRAALGYRKTDAHNVRLMRIERRFRFIPVRIIGSGFKVKRHDGMSGKVILEFRQSRD